MPVMPVMLVDEAARLLAGHPAAPNRVETAATYPDVSGAHEIVSRLSSQIDAQIERVDGP